ncbi:MAG TPA: hypothetical protein P5050_09320 [Bacteroidia bacterium]|nr:hypothetical protein [Sphingobacteriales bacterium]HPD65914.1 hypothetical protein [Bacteroidia bacterium]HRS59407.1 hypothetical protein [Bacteroidia bacterium]HRU68491.1 hypothetical protein [Bacteroidia bacterium]
MKKYDHILLGTAIGILSIIIVVVVFYLAKFTFVSFSDYLSTLTSYKKMLSAMISLAGLPNLLFFFIFLNKEKYNTAKGLILATFILVLIVVVIKIFL